MVRAADGAGLQTVMLAAPTAPDERLERNRGPGPRVRLRRRADGVTGSAALADSATVIAPRLKAITDVPVLVGSASVARAGGRGLRWPTASSSAPPWCAGCSRPAHRRPPASSSARSATPSTAAESPDQACERLRAKREARNSKKTRFGPLRRDSYIVVIQS